MANQEGGARLSAAQVFWLLLIGIAVAEVFLSAAQVAEGPERSWRTVAAVLVASVVLGAITYWAWWEAEERRRRAEARRQEANQMLREPALTGRIPLEMSERKFWEAQYEKAREDVMQAERDKWWAVAGGSIAALLVVYCLMVAAWRWYAMPAPAVGAAGAEQ